MTKLTEKALWELGFNNKYKSVNLAWNYYDFYIDQAEDRDENDNLNPEPEVFYHRSSNDAIETVEQLMEFYFNKTGKELKIDPSRIGTEVEYW